MLMLYAPGIGELLLTMMLSPAAPISDNGISTTVDGGTLTGGPAGTAPFMSWKVSDTGSLLANLMFAEAL